MSSACVSRRVPRRRFSSGGVAGSAAARRALVGALARSAGRRVGPVARVFTAVDAGALVFARRVAPAVAAFDAVLAVPDVFDRVAVARGVVARAVRDAGRPDARPAAAPFRGAAPRADVPVRALVLTALLSRAGLAAVAERVVRGVVLRVEVPRAAAPRAVVARAVVARAVVVRARGGACLGGACPWWCGPWWCVPGRTSERARPIEPVQRVRFLPSRPADASLRETQNRWWSSSPQPRGRLSAPHASSHSRPSSTCCAQALSGMSTEQRPSRSIDPRRSPWHDRFCPRRRASSPCAARHRAPPSLSNLKKCRSFRRYSCD